MGFMGQNVMFAASYPVSLLLVLSWMVSGGIRKCIKEEGEQGRMMEIVNPHWIAECGEAIPPISRVRGFWKLGRYRVGSLQAGQENFYKATKPEMVHIHPGVQAPSFAALLGTRLA